MFKMEFEPWARDHERFLWILLNTLPWPIIYQRRQSFSQNCLNKTSPSQTTKRLNTEHSRFMKILPSLAITHEMIWWWITVVPGNMFTVLSELRCVPSGGVTATIEWESLRWHSSETRSPVQHVSHNPGHPSCVAHYQRIKPQSV